MNGVFHQVGEQAINEALTGHPALAVESDAGGPDSEVGLDAFPVSRMASMPGAVVDHVKRHRCERLGQAAADFGSDWTLHLFISPRLHRVVRRWIIKCNPMSASSRPSPRFHGRLRDGIDRACDADGCSEAGEFRAPRSRSPEMDGYFHFCLEHVRDYNARWDWFAGMDRAEIEAAQRGHPSWDRTTYPFAHHGREAYAHPYGPGQDGPHLDDPLGALSGQPRFVRFGEAATGLPQADRQALATLGLPTDKPSDSQSIRRAYKALVRKLHPDSNGGDRAHEAQLRKVIDAYTQLTTPRPRRAKA
jgi:DnaJ domain